MSSWYDTWADRYAASSTGVSADVPFYVGLALEADGPLVELAVGTGRVAIPVARATRRLVVGIDSSRGMLAQARLRAAEQGVELDLREGDIRELELEEPAALIYCPGRSLLHLPTWADRRRCFERVAASLLPHGRFAWNAFAFDHHIASATDANVVRKLAARLYGRGDALACIDALRSHGVHTNTARRLDATSGASSSGRRSASSADRVAAR
jgi:ubiquinone/menaquinone biosynthesis C-methylase UbiE